jgi:hypothetical protein
MGMDIDRQCSEGEYGWPQLNALRIV